MEFRKKEVRNQGDEVAGDRFESRDSSLLMRWYMLALHQVRVWFAITKSSGSLLRFTSHVPHYLERQGKQAVPGWLEPRSSWLQTASCYSQASSCSVLGQGYHLHLVVDWSPSYRLVEGASEEILEDHIFIITPTPFWLSLKQRA